MYHFAKRGALLTTDKVYILGRPDGGGGATKAKIQRIKFYIINDLGQLEVIADYDLTYQAIDNQIHDLIGKNPPIILHGGSFITA